MTDRTGQPWSGVYNGFSAAPPIQRRHPIPKAATVGVGVGCALALGLLVGLFAKPDLGANTPKAPMRAVTTAAVMPVVVDRVAPPPQPVAQAAGKLEVLPPDMARAAQAPLRASAPLPAAAPAIPDQPRPTSNDTGCAAAGGGAAQWVCEDPALAAADRELNRAYRRALRSGASADQLRADQRDWLAAREETARRSPRGVADLYEQRIGELNQLAEEGPG